jgi:putative Mg2+ transporter-C (MgtC) family protein
MRQRRIERTPMNEWDVLGRTLAALVAGGLIGLERSFRGRAAGMRTYALVAYGSALLVAATQYDLAAATHGGGDPTRVIQGIVTGIGFLGAGVIVKEGFSVRGLTTAASVWVMSAIGVVFGAGLWLSGAAASAFTLLALATLRRVEDRLHVQSFVHCWVSCKRDRILDEDWLQQRVRQCGFSITELSYRLDGRAQLFEYRAVMWSADPNGATELKTSLLAEPAVVDFRISPSRD